MNRRWPLIEEIFHEALEVASAGRSSFIEQRCCGDSVLLAEVRELLEMDEHSHQDLAEVLTRGYRTFLEEEGAAPEEVPGYRLFEELGRGGQSTVYRAERTDSEFPGPVAVKVLRRGLDTEDLLQRFQTERRILAQLDHPQIARILDGGRTRDGRPFFALDLVEGQPLDVHCRNEGLVVRERVQLFVKICGAVSYAHRKLIIHRDLKPGNLLVTPGGAPKLLDFGIAKLLKSELGGERSHATALGTVPMTPDYASPEQVRGDALGTQTDVFSLGVIFFEMLTGTNPFVGAGKSVPELLRSRETLPLSPSSLVEGAQLERIGLGAEGAPKVRRALRGDLDTILLKALHPDVALRYASVEQLEEDLQRFLNGRPVLARPPRISYRVGKFVQRNRPILVTLVVSLLFLALVVAHSGLQLREQRDVALREAARAEEVTGLLVALLQDSDPELAQGRTVTVRELLDRAAPRIERELREQPNLKGSLLELMGKIYGNLGYFEEAESLLKQALKLRQASFAPPAPEIALALEMLGEAQLQAGRYGDAEVNLGQALDQRQKLFPKGDPSLGRSWSDLAAAAHFQGRLEEAEMLYQRALESLKEPRGAFSEDFLETQANLCGVYYQKGELEKAEVLGLQTLKLQENLLGPDHPDVIATEETLAAILDRRGNYQDAEQRLRRILEFHQRVYGPSHPSTVIARNNLGAVLYNLGRVGEAETIFREGLQSLSKAFGDEHELLIDPLLNLANLEDYGHGHWQKAADLYRQGLEIHRKRRNRDPAFEVPLLLRLGELAQKLDNSSEALVMAREALALAEEKEDLRLLAEETLNRLQDSVSP